MLIDPVRRLGNRLLSVEKPARYVGGEYGIIRKDPQTDFKIALSFPDLYDIGMSNFSIRILYTLMNQLEGIACERVFAPAPDFEALLTQENEPLYSLENGTPVSDFDLLAFTIGYELSATSVLTILERGMVPLHTVDRGPNDPIVIAGGSAITNPAPMSSFFDAVFIGEAEGGWVTLAEKLRDAKRQGAGRSALLEILHADPHVWYFGRIVPAQRAVWGDFGCQAFRLQFPLPGLTVVQDHGVIEIMRGCPNGCRFCHAGVAYRPHREKEISEIIDEAQWLFENYGYREITLSSLSTGDYTGLQRLVDELTARFSSRQISFSLPSLRVNSFTLPILHKISEVRRSGLTFAVETPKIQGQRSLNKEVPASRIIEILRSAKDYGWRNAKFYFMIGLPHDTDNTPQAIIDYLEEVRQATGVRIHLTVNSFIPKPHTPFQRAQQLSEEAALDQIYTIKNGLNRKFYKFGFHSPFASVLEGLMSRGDERVGELIEKAYRAGARLDAWEEHLDRDMWRDILKGADWNALDEAVRERSLQEQLPWHMVDIGVRSGFMNQETKRAEEFELTDPCAAPCHHNCGACDDDQGVRTAADPEGLPETPVAQHGSNSERNYRRFLFSFEKTGAARFLSHRNLVAVFQRLFTRKEIPLRYTEGFNPKPKMEFAHPLSLGVSSMDEVAMIYLEDTILVDDFLSRCNSSLPEGLRFSGGSFDDLPTGVKSIMAHYWGSEYEMTLSSGNRTLEEKAELLLAPYIGGRNESDGTTTYRFIYPDGDDAVKGIGRILRNELKAEAQEFNLLRRRSFFNPGKPGNAPLPLPCSRSGP